ncbi:nucleotidyl transferase AbiEii/AbiGii toxin family protein [Deinococcus cellulosilyticus]|uniref:Uncharacterized protein n=1 Tax=Deinococcus cellulosilyticus (strain DSM 18568 / NBRC 106333 / KACC 11606 / 5516J-15) TaxID=1223518 RepID=A0A511N1P3_DEIC1|nr:nucleotidyl transferase AbiEii/AbiGii toxin family protein [Deinococcus cellulosilyticus]GEM46794.1 hypothetical protein DC3_24290 [Deinococcus cellulosilyticus NBRC 106333 = KACC 11606]
MTSHTPEVEPELLKGWLRRTIQHPEQDRLVLRGSMLTSTLCPGARRPVDLDHLVLGDFNSADLLRLIHEILSVPDPSTQLFFERSEIIWEDTAFPGVRVFLTGQVQDGDLQCFQIDFAFGDPLIHPPVQAFIPEVGPVPSCLPEILYAWKLHGLAEFGRGRWRAKDLYDLWVLAGLPMNLDLLNPALKVAFSSRGDDVGLLLDFHTRESWGCSTSGQRKWRTFLRRHQLTADFLVCRTRVREVLSRLEGFHA